MHTSDLATQACAARLGSTTIWGLQQAQGDEVGLLCADFAHDGTAHCVCYCQLADMCVQTLQDSLSGDSKTLMLVNVNPTEADAGESACSLGFAARVRGVELGPAKKQIEAGAEVQELRSQLEAMQRQVRQLDTCPCIV